MICGHCKAADVDTTHVRACSNTPGAKPTDYSRPGTGFPGVAATPTPAVDSIGVYRCGGEFYRVRESRAGRLYAELIIGDADERVAHFEYARGLMAHLHAEDKITLAEAAEFGKAFGACCVCGRTLTNPASIEAGIGPICAGRL